MKRSIALIIAGGLTSLIAIVLLIVLFAGGLPVTEAEAVQASASPATPESIQIDTWQAEVEAANRQIETTLQEREQAWQSRLAEQQAILTQLDQSSQAQMAQLAAQLQAIQAQIEQTDTNLGTLQAHSGVQQ